MQNRDFACATTGFGFIGVILFYLAACAGVMPDTHKLAMPQHQPPAVHEPLIVDEVRWHVTLDINDPDFEEKFRRYTRGARGQLIILQYGEKK